MAYNPTTWNTGDTITATAMNKIENGIANAGGGGGGTCFYTITATDFPTGTSTYIGHFIYMKKEGNTYSYVSLLSSYADEMWVFGNPTGYGGISSSPVPTLENYYLTFQIPSSVLITDASGGFDLNNPIEPGIYLVTGDFSITVRNLA